MHVAAGPVIEAQVDPVRTGAPVDAAGDGRAGIKVQGVVAALEVERPARVSGDRTVVGEAVGALAGLDRRAVTADEPRRARIGGGIGHAIERPDGACIRGAVLEQHRSGRDRAVADDAAGIDDGIVVDPRVASLVLQANRVAVLPDDLPGRTVGDRGGQHAAAAAVAVRVVVDDDGGIGTADSAVVRHRAAAERQALAPVGAAVAVEAAGALPVQNSARARARDGPASVVGDGRAAVHIDAVPVTVDRPQPGPVEVGRVFTQDRAAVVDDDGAGRGADRVGADTRSVAAENRGSGAIEDLDVGRVDVADIDPVLRAFDQAAIVDRVVRGRGCVDAHAPRNVVARRRRGVAETVVRGRVVDRAGTADDPVIEERLMRTEADRVAAIALDQVRGVRRRSVGDGPAAGDVTASRVRSADRGVEIEGVGGARRGRAARSDRGDRRVGEDPAEIRQVERARDAGIGAGEGLCLDRIRIEGADLAVGADRNLAVGQGGAKGALAGGVVSEGPVDGDRRQARRDGRLHRGRARLGPGRAFVERVAVGIRDLVGRRLRAGCDRLGHRREFFRPVDGRGARGGRNQALQSLLIKVRTGTKSRHAMGALTD